MRDPVYPGRATYRGSSTPRFDPSTRPTEDVPKHKPAPGSDRLPVQRTHLRAVVTAATNEEGTPVRTNLHHLLEHRARSHPQSPALSFKNITVSYADLWDLSDRAAAGLRRLGLGLALRPRRLRKRPTLPLRKRLRRAAWPALLVSSRMLARFN